MGFVNQTNATNMVPQKVKVLKVLCQECIQEMETLQFDVDVMGVAAGTDPADLVVEAVPGTPTVVNIQVLTNKVLNVISVPLDVTITLEGTEVGTLTIPNFLITGEVKCPGVVNDGTVNVQKHDLQVLTPVLATAVSFDPVTDIVVVSITVIVEGCAVISKEAILKVNAANLFCACD